MAVSAGTPRRLDRVLLIRFASEMGFALNEIRVFLNGLRQDIPVDHVGRNSLIAKFEKSMRAFSARSASNHSSNIFCTAAARQFKFASNVPACAEHLRPGNERFKPFGSQENGRFDSHSKGFSNTARPI